MTAPADDAFAAFTEMLVTWMAFHKQSPLDGTVSCKLCRVMILDENADGHYEWHEQRGESDPRYAYLAGRKDHKL